MGEGSIDVSTVSSAPEIWRRIPGVDDEQYEVSNFGRIRSLKSWRGIPGPRIRSLAVNSDGYAHTSLYFDGRTRTIYVHRAAALAFHGFCPVGLEARHLNGDKTNNRADNLAWGTHSENMQDRERHGGNVIQNARLRSKPLCPAGHERTKENLSVDKTTGKRKCKKCHAARELRRYHARKAASK